MAAEIIQIDTQDFTSQIYEGQDTNLISTFDLSTSFSSLSYIEYFIYDNNRNIITFDYNFTDYTIQNDGQSAGTNGDISQIIIDPEKSLIDNGFDQGEYITYFNFFNKKIGSELQQLYIAEISSDRTEIRLDSTTLSNLDIVEQTTQFVQEREISTYFLDFYLNFGDNQLAIANNIQLDNTDPNNPTVLVKLYEPLPEEFDINSTLWVVTTLEESIAYQVTFEDEPIIFVDFENISGPNFNIDLKDRVNNSTQNLSYSEILSTSLTSSIQQLNSLFEEKEIDANVDYTSFENYIHFSSAQTRLENFYSKIQLIEQYSASIAVLNNTTNSPTSISSSAAVYESKINNIITNFDGYEYFLYYESSSYAWPKTNTEKPYELAKSNSVTVLTWIGNTNESDPYFGGLLYSASLYDNNNKDNLLYTIPEYLRDDPSNQQYELFVQMVAQHYDNIWIYYKEVTQKYNADNRLEYGISKDIVADAIRDFGIKLYQNNFSNEDLYTAFLGLTPEGGLFPFPNITGSLPTPSGFEYIEYFISASNDFIPLDDVNKSLYKRIYHNLPYLLKSKGTLPGLRALITSYGVPDTILRINEYGGKDKVNVNDWDYWQNEFNYAFNTSGSNFISSSWELNSDWNAPNDVPATLAFRFKTDGLPTSNILYSQSLWYGDGGSALTLTYTGSSYSSGSYSGSIIDPYYQYANVVFYPDINNSSQTASVYLPFYDGGWWSVMITKESDTYTLYSQNKIYEGGDNGTILGFKASSSITYATNAWTNTSTSYFPVSFSISGTIGYDISAYDVGVYDEAGTLAGSFIPFTGSYQEIRYYTVPISESVFTDYTMNPHSIEGNTLNSSPNELAFRASIGGEQYTASVSIHPKVTGSWQTTHSFASDSNFYYDATPNFIPNVEYTFADQPVAGIRNTISDKIRVENNVMPEGDTLSPFISLSQMANISQSYTPSINYLEVAFSPSNEINEDIVDQLGYFNIGEFIGDPRLRSSSAVTYPALDQLRNEYFQKYTKNYDLVDFIRLIKFFDNSLFKMIRDFVPARTSLAAGIVIKQHLLERNKYPQPQVSTQDLDISGTLKPTWNDYQPGTVEHFEGQTGGVFDQFNTISNTSQSWYETINTLSGSVTVLHDSQDEFYNGEFSGSTILISDGILNEAYPIENQSLPYQQVLFYPTLSGSTFPLNEIDEAIFFSNFLNPVTIPQNGEMLIFIDYKRIFFPFPGSEYTATHFKIAKVDSSGNDNTTVLGQLDKILIYKSSTLNYVEYDLDILSESPTYYLYKVNPITKGSFPFLIADNKILNYTISASITNPITITSSIDPGSLIFQPTASINGLNYYDSSSGYTIFGNTPNTQINLTASIITYSPVSSNPFYLALVLERSGQNNSFVLTTDVFSTTTSPQTFFITGSFYPLKGDKYFVGIVTGTNDDTIISNYQYLITQSRNPNNPNSVSNIVEPYITIPNFYNSDENALLNNSFDLRDSSYYMDVDYSSGLTEPVNFQSLISGSATRAKVQDSNYTTLRHIIPRYLGSRSTSQKLNTWSQGDNGTYGKLPTIENLNSYVIYAPFIAGWPPERENTSYISVKYLIDRNGNVVIPNTSENSLSIVQQAFRTGDRVRINVTTPLNGEVDQYRTIIRGGTRIEPILYTQSGSVPNAQWNSTITFEDLTPSNAGAVGNYRALYFNSTPLAPTLNSWIQLPFNSTSYGTPVSTNSYTVTSGVIDDGVNLIVNSTISISTIFALSAASFRIVKDRGGNKTFYPSENGVFRVVTTQESPKTFTLSPQGYTIPVSDLAAGDVIYLEGYAAQLMLISNYNLQIDQYPTPTTPVTSTGVNSIWGFPDPTNYPYVITSSKSALSDIYNANIKQTDLAGSGFNPIVLPWSIKYGDEFRFEGREDFTFPVKKVFAPFESGSGRLFQTGSIEVHFGVPLPISSSLASPSTCDLDHFLIRRYTDDASQILIEGFKPAGTTGPYIIIPEYITPELNKNVDTFITDLTEKGLL
jgi:hypothetical protein